jgi:hypothetical protein
LFAVDDVSLAKLQDVSISTSDPFIEASTSIHSRHEARYAVLIALLGAAVAALVSPVVGWLVFGLEAHALLMAVLVSALGLGAIGGLLGSVLPSGIGSWEPPPFGEREDSRDSYIQ